MSADDLEPIGKPTDWDELYPGRFLKSVELKKLSEQRSAAHKRPPDPQSRVTLTISEVNLYRIDREITRAFVFKDLPDKLLALNKINGLCMRAMFGRKPQEWVGKRVTFFPDTVREAGKMHGQPCIRIWGSPDIPHDMDVPIALHKRKSYTLTMHKVGGERKTEERKPETPPSREPGDD